MKTQCRYVRSWKSAVLACVTSLVAFAALEPANPIAITSISTSGANLVMNADVPAGMQQVRLEMKPTLDGEWVQQGVLDVAPNASPVAFAVAKPDVETAFFRLIATPLPAGVAPSAVSAPTPVSQKVQAKSAPVVSSELGYVTIPPAASGSATDGVLHVKGTIDGSDRMLISRDGIFWDHVNWDWPHGAVSINGVQWKTQEKDYVTTRGNGKLIPASFSLDDVTLEKIQGRDVVALERTPGALVAYINDTFLGASQYEFKIHFHIAPPPAAPAAQSTAARLKISGEIIGSEEFRISAAGAKWTHRFNAYPPALLFNGVLWPLNRTNTVLRNEGTTEFLPPGVDFATAKIVARKGRDLATLWAWKDAVTVILADNPNGSEHYELEISFGPQPTAAALTTSVSVTPGTHEPATVSDGNFFDTILREIASTGFWSKASSMIGTEVPAGGALLVGFNVGEGLYAGHTINKSIQPMFLTREGVKPGRVHGDGSRNHEVMAPPGYAVGAMHVKTGERLDGMSVTFMKIIPGRLALDANDSRQTDWIGGTGGSGARLIGGTGRPVIGVAIKSGSDVDNLGLVILR